MEFKKGDLVKLKSGTSVMKVTKVRKDIGTISCKYVYTHHTQNCRRAGDFEFHETHHPKEDHMSNSPILFETPEGKFGTQIAVNSEGRIVLEIKGSSGQVLAFKSSELIEVVPYTVAIKGVDDNTRHVQVQKDSLKVGDVVVNGIKLGLVTAIDTKNRGATSLNALRVVGTTPVA